MVTDAPHIGKLKGDSYQIGGSGVVGLIEGIPVTLGGDVNIIPDFDEDEFYYGVTGAAGVASGPGAEGHLKVGTTFQTQTFNAFEIFDYCYAKIMEW